LLEKGALFECYSIGATKATTIAGNKRDEMLQRIKTTAIGSSESSGGVTLMKSEVNEN